MLKPKRNRWLGITLFLLFYTLSFFFYFLFVRGFAPIEMVVENGKNMELKDEEKNDISGDVLKWSCSIVAFLTDIFFGFMFFIHNLVLVGNAGRTNGRQGLWQGCHRVAFEAD